MNAHNWMIALAAIGIAVPATASTQRTNEQPTKEAPKAQQAPSNDQVYCIAYEDLVGSRIRQQECKTKAKWAEQGVDVDHLDDSSRG